MNVQELNRAEMEELKQMYLFETTAGPLTWGDIAAACEIPNEIIFDYYEGVRFSKDDFTCNAEVNGNE